MPDDFEYSNGADGSCQECGEPTAEGWHVYCPRCFAQEQGWTRPNADALASQHEDRQRLTVLQIAKRLDELELRLARLEARDRVGRAA